MRSWPAVSRYARIAVATICRAGFPKGLYRQVFDLQLGFFRILVEIFEKNVGGLRDVRAVDMKRRFYRISVQSSLKQVA